MDAVGPCCDSRAAPHPQPNPAPSDTSAIHSNSRIGTQMPTFTQTSPCWGVEAAMPLVLLFSFPLPGGQKFAPEAPARAAARATHSPQQENAREGILREV